MYRVGLQVLRSGQKRVWKGDELFVNDEYVKLNTSSFVNSLQLERGMICRRGKILIGHGLQWMYVFVCACTFIGMRTKAVVDGSI